ncbi:MAG: hypothetical protein ICV60_03320 [Pyrinomonadaceae bacterium]|nr:hypothetical protein [Pyrinomonadaceae bacterium]
MNKTIVIALLLISATAQGFGQGAPEGKRKINFSSVYTDLNTQCRSAVTKAEERELEARGDDIPFVCKGYGGYEILLASHGAITQFEVRIKGRDAESVVYEMLSISDPIYTRKVEWRLADGVPFAVIFRRDVNDEESDPAAKKKIGEVLRVVGLKDRKIDFEVDVKKSANPNEEARRMADNAYAKSR